MFKAGGKVVLLGYLVLAMAGCGSSGESEPAVPLLEGDAAILEKAMSDVAMGMSSQEVIDMLGEAAVVGTEGESGDGQVFQLTYLDLEGKKKVMITFDDDAVISVESGTYP